MIFRPDPIKQTKIRTNANVDVHRDRKHDVSSTSKIKFLYNKTYKDFSKNEVEFETSLKIHILSLKTR